MPRDQCRSPSDDGRYRRKHVKNLFVLKIVALDGTYSLATSVRHFTRAAIHIVPIPVAAWSKA
jgi:hypothetical protein